MLNVEFSFKIGDVVKIHANGKEGKVVRLLKTRSNSKYAIEYTSNNGSIERYWRLAEDISLIEKSSE